MSERAAWVPSCPTITNCFPKRSTTCHSNETSHAPRNPRLVVRQSLQIKNAECSTMKCDSSRGKSAQPICDGDRVSGGEDVHLIRKSQYFDLRCLLDGAVVLDPLKVVFKHCARDQRPCDGQGRFRRNDGICGVTGSCRLWEARLRAGWAS